MIDLFTPCYAAKFRELRENRNSPKESVIANELGITQQKVSQLLAGSSAFTEDIIENLCRYFKITISEFKKLEYTNEVRIFVKQVIADTGMPFDDQQHKIKELEIANCFLRKENNDLVSENSQLKWELTKMNKASEIVASRIKSKIYVAV